MTNTQTGTATPRLPRTETRPLLSTTPLPRETFPIPLIVLTALSLQPHIQNQLNLRTPIPDPLPLLPIIPHLRRQMRAAPAQMIPHGLISPHMLDREPRLRGAVGHARARQDSDALDQPQIFHFPETRGTLLEAEDLHDAGDAAEG